MDIDSLIKTAVFSLDADAKLKAQEDIGKLAIEKGAYPASIKSLYDGYGRGEVSGFSIPAINVRTLSYDLARLLFRVMKQHSIGAVIFEISHTESAYTGQNPGEFAASVLAAAIKEAYIGPVFLQGDHCQFSLKRYTANKEEELENIKKWATLLINHGFYNIDIDGSTLVDLSLPTVEQQQKENAYVTANVTKYLRGVESDNVTLSLGGEIGHIGDKNSTVEDFDAFMAQYLHHIGDLEGISKIAVQTGTTHGGTPSKDGHIELAQLDYSILEAIGKRAREEYRISGPVQHGASTIPINYFSKFPQVGTVEVHLATGLQNIILDNLPPELQEKLYSFVENEFKKDWEQNSDWTREQFLYKTRKKALGPLKSMLWDMDELEKDALIKRLETYLVSIFEQLGVYGTRSKILEYFPS